MLRQLHAGLFELLQDRGWRSRAGRISGDGKFSCQALQQLVGWCDNTVYPAKEDDLVVEVRSVDREGESAASSIPANDHESHSDDGVAFHVISYFPEVGRGSESCRVNARPSMIRSRASTCFSNAVRPLFVNR